MTLRLRLCKITFFALIAAGCTEGLRSEVAPSPTYPMSPSPTLEVEFVAAYRDGPRLWATVCYEQPNGHNWIPGRHSDDATISVHDSVYAMSQLELVGFRFSLNGPPTHRCDRLLFSVPEQPPAQVYILEIQHLAGETPTAQDCPEVQRKLAEQQTGIEIECLQGDETFSYGVITHPDTMTDLQATYFVDDLAGEVIKGPWTFEFTASQLGP